MAAYSGVLDVKGGFRQTDGPYTCGAYDIPGNFLVYFASSLLLRVPTDGVTIAGILMGDATAGDTDCMIMPVTSDLIFEIGIGAGTAASLIMGKKYGITANTAGACSADQELDEGETGNDSLVFHRFGRQNLTTGLYVTAWVSVAEVANQWDGTVEGA